MKKNAWILIYCCFFFIQQNYAQHFPDLKFSLLPEISGLPAKSITCMLKDKKGLVWMGTENDGLIRYDGRKVKSYLSIDGSPGIEANYIARICEDDSGWLWISTIIGLYHLNPETEKSELFQHNDADPSSIASNEKTSPYTDSRKRLWILSSAGLQLYNPVTKKFIRYATPTINNPGWQKHAKGVLQLLEDAQHQLWVSSAYGLYLVDTVNKNCKPYFTGKYCWITNVFQDNKQQMWVSFWGNGLTKFFPATGKYEPWPAPGTIINFLNEWNDEHGKSWLTCSADNGLTLSDPATGAYKSYPPDITLPGSVKGLEVRFIYKDNEKRFWIFTDQGINIIDPAWQHFNSFYLSGEKTGMDILTTSYPADLLKTGTGYEFINWPYGYLYTCNNKWEIEHCMKEVNIHNKLYPVNISTIQQTDNNETWLGTTEGFLKRIEGNSFQQYKPTDSFPDIDLQYSATRMKKRPDGLYWAMFEDRGLYVFDPSEGKFLKNYRRDYKGMLSSLEYDRNGNVWIGTSTGLYLYDKQTDSFIRFPIDCGDNKKNGLYNHINQLYFDKNNMGWIATYKGLVQFSPVEKKYWFIKDPEKSNSYSAKKILEDTTGIIWTMADYFIQAYNKHTKEFHYYDDADGLPAGFTGFKGVFKWINDSCIAAGSVHTIITFNPYELLQHKKEAPLIFTDVDIDGNRYTPITNGVNQLQLIAPAGTRNINIQFALLNYTASEKNILFYRLATYKNSKWIEAKDGIINLTALPHGEYLLQVKGNSTNSTSVYSTTEMLIIVRPHWYQSILFQVFSVMLTALLIFLFTRWRVKSIRKSANLKQLVTETEIAALKAQLNPHFIFNCINNIDSFIHSNDKYNATLYLNKFAKLLRNILESSKQNTLGFSKDIETLRLYIELEELRNDNKFKTKISIDKELLESDYKVPPLIIQPFVENAIQHGLKNKDGNDGLLEISVTKKDDKIMYSIRDNGIGREAAGRIAQNKEHSYGMQLSFDRIRLFNKEAQPSVHITDLYNDNKPLGTLIIVTLKIT